MRFAVLMVASLLWALLCNSVLELSLDLSADHLFNDILMGRGLLPFLLSTLLLLVLIVVVVSATGRFWVSAVSVLSVLGVVAVANHLKLAQRDEPLYPSDLDFLREWQFLLQMVSPAQGMLLVTAVGATCAVVWGLRRITSQPYPPLGPSLSTTGRRRLVALRLAALVIGSLVLFQAATFNHGGNVVRSVYEATGVRWAWWHQTANYERNGVVAGFLYNTDVPAMQQPQGYSAAAMADIVERYGAAADRVNRARAEGVLHDVNIVVVLSEAFSDPTAVPGIDVAEDPIPMTRQLMRETTSGNMLAQLVGGGTANMEFEALTGMSLALFEPQMNSPFQMLLPKHQAFPSMVRFLERGGHRPIAIHPYVRSMYKRDRSYPVLGFEEFVDDEKMTHRDRIENGDFISDESAFMEVEDRLRTSDEPLFVNLVTMQNHYPTDAAYADPIPVTGLPDWSAELAGGFTRGLTYTDKAVHDFLARLADTDEKTAVIFFGDHLPGFWPDNVVEQNPLLMRQTPFFLWSNFRDFGASGQRVVSPTHFLPMLFEQLQAPIPPYFALLDAVRREVPAMEQGIILGSDGSPLRRDQLSPVATRVLRDYRMVQYDLSIGERWSWGPMLGGSTAGRSSRVMPTTAR